MVIYNICIIIKLYIVTLFYQAPKSDNKSKKKVESEEEIIDSDSENESENEDVSVFKDNNKSKKIKKNINEEQMKIFLTFLLYVTKSIFG